MPRPLCCRPLPWAHCFCPYLLALLTVLSSLRQEVKIAQLEADVHTAVLTVQQREAALANAAAHSDQLAIAVRSSASECADLQRQLEEMTAKDNEKASNIDKLVLRVAKQVETSALLEAELEKALMCIGALEDDLRFAAQQRQAIEAEHKTEVAQLNEEVRAAKIAQEKGSIDIATMESRLALAAKAMDKLARQKKEEFVLKSRLGFVTEMWGVKKSVDMTKRAFHALTVVMQRRHVALWQDLGLDLDSMSETLEVTRDKMRRIIASYLTEDEKLHLGIPVLHVLSPHCECTVGHPCSRSRRSSTTRVSHRLRCFRAAHVFSVPLRMGFVCSFVAVRAEGTHGREAESVRYEPGWAERQGCRRGATHRSAQR